MSKDYASRHRIPVEAIDPKLDQSYSTGKFANFVPGAGAYLGGMLPGLLVPIWYTGWRDETLSWHLTCSFHAHLNPSPLVTIRGPEAKRFLSENFVNNIDNFPIGLIKHGIMCLDNGLVATHGVLMRTGDDEYQSYWHSPYLEYAFHRGDYNAELEDLTSSMYLFQLQGPRVLQILADATGDDLRDLPFRGFRDTILNGHTVRILRLGMSGTLGYEIHGPSEFAKIDQKRLLEAGNPYGMRQIGIASYSLDHVPGGFAQASNNFMSAIISDQDFLDWAENGDPNQFSYLKGAAVMELSGSAGNDMRKHFFNPFEIGLGYCVNWNHEFRGKAALRDYVSGPHRRMVTLEWNADDLAEIYRSQFNKDEEPYAPIDFPGWEAVYLGRQIQGVDRVLNKAGEDIGLSIGRTHSNFHRVMLSLGVIDDGHRDIGTEVFVLWGDDNSRQKKIRAKVVQTPYNQDLSNENLDARTLPLDLKVRHSADANDE